MFVQTTSWRGRIETYELEIYKGHDNRTRFGIWSSSPDEGVSVALLPEDLDQLILMLQEWKQSEEISLVEGTA